MRTLACSAWVLLSLLVGSDAAARQAPPLEVTQALAAGVTVNWTRGLIIARSGAAADLRAPTAAIARVKAERTARVEAGDKAIAGAVTLVARAGKIDASSLERDLVTLAIRYSSDGSVIAEVGLPIESVRRALVSPNLSAPTAKEPTALVVDAARLAVTPVIGPTIAAGAQSYAGPTLYFRKPSKRHQHLLGARPARVRATKHEAGRLELDADAAAALVAARDAGAPIFVLIK